jgi:hypothetical protein
MLALEPLYGEAARLPESRHIVGGEAVDPILYPFVMRVDVPGSPSMECTGTLIADNWVLTAAHCVDGRDARIIGDSCFSLVGIEHGGVSRSACEIVIHDLYDPFQDEGLPYDLALVRIQPFTGRTHRPVELASGSNLATGTETWTAGMATDYPPTIKVAGWPLMDCPRAYPPAFLCTQGNAGVIVEYGDSGGPLLVKREGGWVQIGVVLRVNSETHVIAYADLSRHRDWIRSVTGAASSPVVVPPAPPPPPPTFRPAPSRCLSAIQARR